MKLNFEIAAEGGAMTLKGSATFPFDLSIWKYRLSTWTYRMAIAALLCWPTQCDGRIRLPTKCQSTDGCVVTVGHQTVSSGLVTEQSSGVSPAAGSLSASDL